MTDEELIARARAGDSEALGALLIARQDQIYRTAYLYTHNQADALDVVQETAVQAIQSVRRLRQPEYFTTWLMRIVMNVALKQQRGRARVVPLADPEQGSTGFAEQSGKRLDLADQLALLPPRYRQPLILFYYNDLSIAAIGPGPAHSPGYREEPAAPRYCAVKRERSGARCVSIFGRQLSRFPYQKSK